MTRQPLPILALTEKERERFDRYALRANGCWIWQGSIDLCGYGRLKLGGRYFRAHRVALALSDTPVPVNRLVCHRCDNPPCVNPDHLFLGTPKDNIHDAVRKGRFHPRPFRVGISHPRARLTEDVVREIRASSLGSKEIASTLGVSRSAVHRARHRITWAHIQ